MSQSKPSSVVLFVISILFLIACAPNLQTSPPPPATLVKPSPSPTPLAVTGEESVAPPTRILPTPTEGLPEPTHTPLALDHVIKKIDGISGGLIEMTNGPRIEIPPDALEGTTEIGIAVVDPPGELPIGWQPIGDTYDIQIGEKSLKKPLRISFPLPEVIERDDFEFRAFHWNGEEFVDLGGEVEGNFLGFYADSFSEFVIAGIWKSKEASIKIANTTNVYTGGNANISVLGTYAFGQLPLNVQPMVGLDVELILWLDQTRGAGHATGFPQLDRKLDSTTLQLSIDLENAEVRTPSRIVTFSHQFSVPLEKYIKKDATEVRLYVTAEFADGIVDTHPLNTAIMSDPMFSIIVDTGLAKIETDPSEGAPGTSFVLSGFNFSPGETVKLSAKLSAETTQVETITFEPDEYGHFQQGLTVPADVEPGKYELIARGTESGEEASAIFSVLESDSPDDTEGSDTDSASSSPETDDQSRCLEFGDLPPLDLVLSINQNEPTTIQLPVVDSCGEYSSDQWTLYPWIEGIQDMYMDGNTIVVSFSPNATTPSYFEGRVGVRYPTETEPILVSLSLRITGKDSGQEEVDTVCPGLNLSLEEISDECRALSLTPAESVNCGKRKYILTSCNGACAGTKIGGTYIYNHVFSDNLVVWPEMGRYTFQKAGMNTYERRYAVSHGQERFERVTYSCNGFTWLLEDDGRLYGEYIYELKLEPKKPSVDIRTWLSERCSLHPPSHHIDVLVQLTDYGRSFGFYIDPSGDCQLSDQIVNEADIIITISSTDLIDLLEGSVWYSTLVKEGRISVRYTEMRGREEGRSLRTDFLEFLLSTDADKK